MTKLTPHVLGISALFHDSAAALVEGTKIVAAAQEERFTRIKGDWRFPNHAIGFCQSLLPDQSGLDAVAFYENPLCKMERVIDNAVANYPRGAPIWPRTLLTLSEINTRLSSWLEAIEPDKSKIFFTPHHRAHAASAFLPSPFDSAAVLVCDGVGEFATTSIWSGADGALTPVSEIRFPHSLGLFYSAFTQYCGFKVNSGEYKLMGLAPFGDPNFVSRILDEIIDVKVDGSFHLNLSLFGFHTSKSTINPLFEQLLGRPARAPEEPVEKHYMDIACSAQTVVSEIMAKLARTAIVETGHSRLCLAGGVALNCVSNGNLLASVEGLEKIWIQPAAGDAGGALGAALDVAAALMPKRSGSSSKGSGDLMQGACLGPEYVAAEIEEALISHSLAYEVYENETALITEVVAMLENGNIVGHFAGRMEYGPRALGNRSILADPRPQGMADRVNSKIKFREGWRPFAPVVLIEAVADYFESDNESPYMLLATTLNPKYRRGRSLRELRANGIHDIVELQRGVESEFNAVTHVDYSSRVQTVTESSSSRIYDIVRKFHASTGCPMLLNTSFNVRGQPIVCTPQDAVRCFVNTHMDAIVIGDFIARRSDQTASVNAKVGAEIFDAD